MTPPLQCIRCRVPASSALKSQQPTQVDITVLPRLGEGLVSGALLARGPTPCAFGTSDSGEWGLVSGWCRLGQPRSCLRFVLRFCLLGEKLVLFWTSPFLRANYRIAYMGFLAPNVSQNRHPFGWHFKGCHFWAALRHQAAPSSPGMMSWCAALPNVSGRRRTSNPGSSALVEREVNWEASHVLVPLFWSNGQWGRAW